ncbi:MAG: nucleotidyltransferase domain-containing protein, partial [Phaeodactylibacter sp.]|nr:nucleotidyltransferase domain-containing protein [Phaeodactylibacter sp.]
LDIKPEKLRPFLEMLKESGFLSEKGILELQGIDFSEAHGLFSEEGRLEKKEGAIKAIQHYFEEAGLPVEKVWLFGSYARNEHTPLSDIDLMIRFQPDSKIDLWDFAGIMQDLEGLLGCKVDLVREGGAKSFAIPNVEKDKVLIYEEKTTGQRALGTHS